IVLPSQRGRRLSRQSVDGKAGKLVEQQLVAGNIVRLGAGQHFVHGYDRNAAVGSIRLKELLRLVDAIQMVDEYRRIEQKSHRYSRRSFLTQAAASPFRQVPFVMRRISLKAGSPLSTGARVSRSARTARRTSVVMVTPSSRAFRSSHFLSRASR